MPIEKNMKTNVAPNG